MRISAILHKKCLACIFSVSNVGSHPEKEKAVSLLCVIQSAGLFVCSYTVLMHSVRNRIFHRTL